jgi:pimeloyl-ACP methyl ester carboxylesterase
MTRRILTWTGAVAALVAVALVAAGAWRFSDELRDELLVPPSLPPGAAVAVSDVGEGTVTLLRSAAAVRPGTWGIASAGSYGRIGTVIDSDTTVVTRSYSPVEGGIGPGTAVLDPIGYRGDPAQALDRRFEDVAIETELGPAPAWLIGRDFATWVVYVHGAGGREEVMRVAPSLLDSGFAVLAISYRNDPEAPTAPINSWGFHEWPDVEAAIEFALANGADNIYLMGSGAGGSAVLTTLGHTEHIRAIRGVVLESAVLDLASVEELRRPDAGLIGSLGRALASWRFGVEWSLLDHVSQAAELRRPVLLLHGTADMATPVALADDFARAGDDMVEYHRFEGAGQGEVPAVAPRHVDRLIRDFLIKHLPTPE